MHRTWVRIDKDRFGFILRASNIDAMHAGTLRWKRVDRTGRIPSFDGDVQIMEGANEKNRHRGACRQPVVTCHG
jgi:hypothetical protein